MFHPANVGRFYTSKKVADDLVTLAKKCGLNRLRVSGGEPTIGKRHLLELLDNLRDKRYLFILETNGIPIAYDESYAKELSKYDFIHVRVSLKGCNEREFSMLTGAKPNGFKLQLKSLKELVKVRVSCHASVMTSFSPEKSLRELVQRLKRISPRLADEIEIEELILYPHVAKRLRDHKLKYYAAYTPKRVPREQI
jgi:uncharacterized Fe-S cluster-containing radical SAM superfamily protein